MSPEQTFAATWQKAFQGNLILPREVLDYALTNATFFSALSAVLPQISVHPHPDYLRAWLKFNENRFLQVNPTTTLRFSRAGHRWCLMEVPAEIAHTPPAQEQKHTATAA